MRQSSQPSEKLDAPSPKTPHIVVGIGASAGGLDAIERFFDHVPNQSGLTFVVVQHLSPDFRSLMDELLASTRISRFFAWKMGCRSSRTPST